MQVFVHYGLSINIFERTEEGFIAIICGFPARVVDQGAICSSEGSSLCNVSIWIVEWKPVLRRVVSLHMFDCSAILFLYGTYFMYLLLSFWILKYSLIVSSGDASVNHVHVCVWNSFLLWWGMQAMTTTRITESRLCFSFYCFI